MFFAAVLGDFWRNLIIFMVIGLVSFIIKLIVSHNRHDD